MKIDGLLFKRLDEDFDLFTKGFKHKNKIKSTKEAETSRVIELYEEKILGDSLKTLFDRYTTVLKIHLKNQETISKEMEHSFRYFFAYINTSNQVYESIRKYLNSNTIIEKNKLIIPYYGYLVRIADQIGAMLLNGFPDGALRIWRSFYEYSAVLLLFIKQRDNAQLQEKYIDHFHRSKRKKAESFQKNHKDLRFPSLDQDLLDALQKASHDHETKYGKKFLEDDYGWCNEVLKPSGRITFRDIEEYAGLSRFRPFYIWASGYCHPGFESLLDFFEEKNNSIILNYVTEQCLQKRSFVDPMQFTLAIFHEVNVEFLKIYSADSEYSINLLMFRKVFEALLKSFDEV